MNLAHDEKDAKGERERFEAHCCDVGIPISRGDDGGYEYADFRTNAAWDAWQAARADTAKQVREAADREQERCIGLARGYLEHHKSDGSIRKSINLSVVDSIVGAIKVDAIRARSAQPDAGTAKCGCCATGCPAGQCRHAKENP